jgi:hypothetical protein
MKKRTECTECERRKTRWIRRRRYKNVELCDSNVFRILSIYAAILLTIVYLRTLTELNVLLLSVLNTTEFTTEAINESGTTSLAALNVILTNLVIMYVKVYMT